MRTRGASLGIVLLNLNVETYRCYFRSHFPMLDDGYLRRYLETGVGRVVDYTRVLLGLHKRGHIFPMFLAVREVASADGALTFLGMLRAVETSEQHIIVDSDNRITACSLESFRLLDLQPRVLAQADRPRISEWVAEWDSVKDAMIRDAGADVLSGCSQTRVCNRRPAARR